MHADEFRRLNVSKSTKLALKPRKQTAKQPKTDLFHLVLTKELNTEVVKEHIFHPTRKWRFDYAIPSRKIAIEIDGGVWTNGRHNRATGYLGDLKKFNAAAALGWRVLKFTPDERFKTETMNIIRETVNQR